jgi:divalent metal cation (Fe/Co/Zn/Cd) transporter
MDWTKRLAVWSVVIGTIVLGLKYFAYYLTGSIALYSDALKYRQRSHSQVCSRFT